MNKILTYATVCAILIFPVVVKAQLKKTINLPAPVLKTNTGGVYTETSWDLDLMKFNFTRPADNPAPPGDVFNPQFSGAHSSSAPTIGEYTLQAKEDRSINTYGSDFEINGKGASTVWMFRQTKATDPRLYHPALIRGDKGFILPTVDAGEPYGMYLMWVENEKGSSYPVRINAPVITWLDQDKAVVGDTVSVYGRNLSHNNDTTDSYVFLRTWSAGSQVRSIKCKVTSVNAYKVKFVVPEKLIPNSAYEVWLHNGHGGSYGWAGPMKLSIYLLKKSAGSGRLLNVKDYGAVGNGSVDDSKAIQKAIDNAHDDDSVFFPAGTYRLASDSLTSTKRLTFFGAGSDKSVISCDSAYSRADMLSLKSFPSQIFQLSFSTSKPHGKGLNVLVHADGNSNDRNQEGFTVRNCSFTTAAFGGNAVVTNLYGIKCVSVEHVDQVNIFRNRFETQEAINVFAARQVRIQHNKIYGNWKVTKGNGNLMLSFPARVREMDISDNAFESVDKDGPLNDGDRIIVRAIVFQNWRGGRYDRVYIGSNTVQRAGNPWDNSGEIILFELPTSNQIYHIVSLQGAQVELNGDWKDSTLALQTLAIIKNTGIGQYRRIISNTGSRLVLDRPWDVEPDSSSVLSLNSSAENVVIYKNEVDGIPNYFDQESATSGIQLYGAAFNNVVDGNRFSNVHHGIYVTGFAGHPSTNSESTGAMGNLITNNQITNAVYGLEDITVMYRYTMPSPLPAAIPWASNVNNVFRDNRVSNLKQFRVDSILHGGYGIIVGQVYNDWQSPVWNGPWVQRALIEHNTVTNAESRFLWLRQHQQWTTARKNVFMKNEPSGKVSAVYFSPQNAGSYVIDNDYRQGIDTLYGGKQPGAQLSLSQKLLVCTTTKSQPLCQENVYIGNAGTGKLSVVSTTNVSWINLLLNEAEIPNENTHVKLTADINSSKMKKGIYYAIVTVEDRSAGVSENIVVKLIVKE